MGTTVFIYRSVWKNLLLLLVTLVFVVMGVFALQKHPDDLMLWLGISFFGIGGVFLLFLVLKERLMRTPFLTVTDKSVVMSTLKDWEINFVDVERFFLISMGRTKFIGIEYKPGVEHQKMDDATTLGRWVRQFNVKASGFQESIPADGLTIKPQQLCDLLNERLQSYHSNLSNATK